MRGLPVLLLPLLLVACQSRVVSPPRKLQVRVKPTEPPARLEIEEGPFPAAGMVTTDGKVTKLYYVRNKKGKALESLIRQAFGKDYVTLAVQPDFYTYNAQGVGTGGLDLLVVSGTPDRVREMDDFIALVEADVLQVEIAVRVVEVTRTAEDQRGINVAVEEVNPKNPNTLFNQIASAFNTHGFIRSLSPAGLQAGPYAFQGTRLLLDTIQHDLKLDMAIELLSRFQNVEVLSAPTIRVLNGHPARIETGERTPVTTATFNKGGIASVNTTYQNTGVTLSVVPTVVAEDTVRLEIRPEVSSVTGFTDPATSGGFAAPFISTRKAQTVVNVKDGEIFLLGGLYATREIVVESKLPLLGDLPVIGALFSSNNKERVQSEILFFLQPRILAPESGMRGRLVLPPEERK